MSPTWLAPVLGVGGAAILAGVFIACRSTSTKGSEAPGDIDRPLSMQSVRTGMTSAIMEERVVVARSSQEFSDLWNEHASLQLPTPPAPEVDFDTSMLVALFGGQQPTAGYSVEVVSVEADGDRLRVSARLTAPEPDAISAQVVTSPFHMVRVDRTGGVASVVWL